MEREADQPICVTGRTCTDADRVCVEGISDGSDRCVTRKYVCMYVRTMRCVLLSQNGHNYYIILYTEYKVC